MENTVIMHRFIKGQVVKALINVRLSYDHPIGAVLEREAEIGGLRQAYVRVADGQGGWLTLEERAEQLKADPRFRDSIPNPTRLARNDESSVRDHFEQIAKGTAIVE
jgi:hypothetical protein